MSHTKSVTLSGVFVFCACVFFSDGGQPALAGLQSLVADAAAQESGTHGVRILALPEQSIWSKLYHNYLGFPRKHIWFVIADRAATLREANQKLLEVSKIAGDVPTEVYKPAGNGRGYFVVAGRPMKAEEAEAMVKKLNEATGTKRALAWSPLVRNPTSSDNARRPLPPAALSGTAAAK